MIKAISLPGTGKGPGTNIYDVSCPFTLSQNALSWLLCVGGKESSALLGTTCLQGSSWKCGKRLRVFCSASEFLDFAVLHITLCSVQLQLFQPWHIKGSYTPQSGDDLH